ncbi:hypothetical protein FOZ62_011256, partial [Perkinsus olseni]
PRSLHILLLRAVESIMLAFIKVEDIPRLKMSDTRRFLRMVCSTRESPNTAILEGGWPDIISKNCDSEKATVKRPISISRHQPSKRSGSFVLQTPSRPMARIFPPIATVIVLVALVKAEPLSVPLQEGNVTLVLDGQALPFEVTSGTGRSFAFYGPQYERVYGSDSCETSYYKCYFCPKENPCKDIFERKKWTAEFEDGVYHYVEHN